MTKQEFLAASLPYGLKLQFKEREEKYCRKQVIGTLGGIYSDGTIVCHDTVNAYPAKFKSVLHPLSDLTKTIVHKGKEFVPLIELLKNGFFDTSEMSKEEIMSFVKVYSYIDLISLNDLPLYLQWHFDLFGGIESGEAIDVNTLPENPYK